MSKINLMDDVLDVLRLSGFTTSEAGTVRNKSFDFVARKDKLLLLFKVLSNIDGLTEESSHEMKMLAKHLFGSPLVVGEKTRNRALETGVMYRRYGIPSINVRTLYEYFVNRVPIYVHAGPGGFYVGVDKELLKQSRFKENMSLGQLASKLGVSRRCVSKYEEGMDVTIETAIKLEEVFKRMLIEPLDLVEEPSIETDPEELYIDICDLSDLEQNILTTMVDMGFEVHPTAKSPFNAVSTGDCATILTGISQYNLSMVKRAKLVSSISNVALTESVFIVEGSFSPSKIEDTVLVRIKELDDIDDSLGFVDLIHSRKESVF